MDIDGISSIEMTPDWHVRDIRARIKKSIAAAHTLRSSIAYWTVPPAFVSPLLASRLKEPDGFLCVDGHLPTDIDQLAALVKLGASVRIHCEDIPTYRQDGKKPEPLGLVHGKIMLFWMRDRTAELWVGSHNWTRRGIAGLNAESSLVVRMSDSCALFAQAVEYLERIKKVCDQFDLSEVDEYKQFQRTQQSLALKKTIEIEASDADRLLGLVINVFGSDSGDIKGVSPLSRIYLDVFDESGAAKYLYRANVIQVDLLEGHTPAGAGILFDPRRYAFRYGKRFPKLLPVSQVTSDILSAAAYSITLEITNREFGSEAVDRPVAEAWEEEPLQSPFLEGLNPDQLDAIFQGRRPVVRVPAETSSVPVSTALEIRRAMHDRPLIAKKIVRRRAP